jgi:hypothetical protein
MTRPERVGFSEIALLKGAAFPPDAQEAVTEPPGEE